MNRKTAGNQSKEKMMENDKKRKPNRESSSNVLTQTADKRNQPSEPHKRFKSSAKDKHNQEKKKNVSNQKKFKQYKMLYTIKKLQRNSEFMIPKAPFRRLVREIAREVSEEEFNWQPTAMEALQYTAEDFMTDFFTDSYACAEHAKRITLMSKDLALARRIRGNRDPSNW